MNLAKPRTSFGQNCSAERFRIGRIKERTVSLFLFFSRVVKLTTFVGVKVKGQDLITRPKPRPYVVERWHLDDTDYSPSVPATTQTSCEITTEVDRQVLSAHVNISALASERAVVLEAPQSRLSCSDQTPLTPPSIIFPLSTDHLLHLIQYNVYRAFVSNKRTLNVLLTGWSEKPSSPTTCPIGGPYRDDTSVYPLNPNIPLCLRPTHLQQTRLHSLWINLIPFPRVRDNLIRREGSFDHWDLLHDLIGELMNFTPVRDRQRAPYNFTVSDPGLRTAPFVAGPDECAVTSGRRGLIVWGEPCDMLNWEIMPGFIEKWSWAVEGCDDVIRISNRWRLLRGEEQLRLAR